MGVVEDNLSSVITSARRQITLPNQPQRREHLRDMSDGNLFQFWLDFVIFVQDLLYPYKLFLNLFFDRDGFWEAKGCWNYLEHMITNFSFFLP